MVGEVAKRQAITNPDHTVRSIKRHMGTDWSIEIAPSDMNPQPNGPVYGVHDAAGIVGMGSRQSRSLLPERFPASG